MDTQTPCSRTEAEHLWSTWRHSYSIALLLDLGYGSLPYSHPDPTGVNCLGRLAAGANWRGLSSLASYAVALDWMGNQEIDEHFRPARARTCTAAEARRLSGLDAGSARHAFPAGTTPPWATSLGHSGTP